MSDELDALIVKYDRIARRERAARLDAEGEAMTRQRVLACLIARLVALTPAGAEREACLVVAESFDIFRPGWRR